MRGLPSEVVLEPVEEPVPKRSAVNLDSVESVSIGVLVDRLGRLSDDRMRQVCVALAVAVACDGHLRRVRNYGHARLPPAGDVAAVPGHSGGPGTDPARRGAQV